MYKTLFCQFFMLFFCCYSLSGSTSNTFNDFIGPENPPDCPLVFDIIIDVDESEECLIPANVCEETSTISGPISNAIVSRPLMADLEGNENDEYGPFAAFGIKLDLRDFQTVPLFLEVIPVLISCGNWDVHIRPLQSSWGFAIIDEASMTLGVSHGGILVAEINFSPVDLGLNDSYIDMAITLPQTPTKFSTYSYCEQHYMMSCEEYDFPPFRPSYGICNSLVSNGANSSAGIHRAASSSGHLIANQAPSTLSSFNWQVVNPFREELNISWPTALSQATQLMLYTIEGKQVQQFKVPAGENHYRISTSHLPSGTYLLRMIIGNEIQSKIIVKG